MRCWLEYQVVGTSSGGVGALYRFAEAFKDCNAPLSEPAITEHDIPGIWDIKLLRPVSPH